MANAMMAMSRITGSASMKNGIWPDVSDTAVEESRMRQKPVDSMMNPVCSFFFR